MEFAPRILVFEDDGALRTALCSTLRAEGYAVEAKCDGLTVRHDVAGFRPDLAVVDVRLPHGPSGLSIARILREMDEFPIIFLTAADGVEDRLAGFAAGADDYLVKPFVMAELVARLRALLRRKASSALTLGRSPTSS
jgi:two-component system, OmpR family, response regulator